MTNDVICGSVWGHLSVKQTSRWGVTFPLQSTLYSISSDTFPSWATNKGAPSEIRALGIPHCPHRRGWSYFVTQEEIQGVASTTNLCRNLESKTESVGTGWRLLLCLKGFLLSIKLWRTTFIRRLRDIFHSQKAHLNLKLIR